MKTRGGGYPAREGWFIPKWIVERCGALAYPSWMPGRDQEVQQAFESASEVWTADSNLEVCHSEPASSDCEFWVKDENTKDPQIVVHLVSGYGGTFQEAFVKNNNMNVGLRFHSYSDQMRYVRQG